MIAFVWFSLKRAWQGFWRNAVMSLAATATMVLMLLLLAGFWIIQTGLLAGLEFTEQKVEVVAYIQPNATETQVEGLRAQLEAMSAVESVAYVNRDEALDRLNRISSFCVTQLDQATCEHQPPRRSIDEEIVGCT